MCEYELIIWDWNGTLLDDVGAAMASVNDMLNMRDIPPIDIYRYRECICVPIRGFYERVMDMSKEDYSVIIEQFNYGYQKHLAECDLTCGVRDVLKSFESAGVRQIVVTSSNTAQVTENIKKYGIFDCFDAVLGADDFLADSKIDRAKNYIAKTQVHRVLCIGDLLHDADMAREIGADCILLSSGHESHERLKNSGVTVVDDIKELLAIFDMER